jgi:hypothetical protein
MKRTIAALAEHIDHMQKLVSLVMSSISDNIID